MAKVIAYLESIAFAVIVVIVAVFFLSGCAATKPKVMVEYVQATQIEPPIITRPDLDTDYLKDGMDAGTVIQSHRLTIKKLQQWGLELEAALNAYRIQGK
jgi:PBP1b-binding outer membrane lipoprotein LpoB